MNLNPMKAIKDRQTRLLEQERRGQRFDDFWNELNLDAFFSGAEAKQLEKLLNTDITDDEARWRLTVAIKTLSRFKGFIRKAVVDGDTAKKELEKLIND